ncbi:MAG: UPF0182 family protein [Oscillatoria princeps RMCB-10]|jgi:uncharacterized membrane protein (UPF0182 family)|nr:UPF0182 family protein [Oscillatoria princeps RMCB-10]
MQAKSWNRQLRWAVLLLGLWLGFDLVAHLVAESLWFQEVGYFQVFLLRIQTQGGLWAAGFGITAGFLLGNLALAQKLKHPKPEETASAGGGFPPLEVIGWRWLLPLVLGLELVLVLLLLHYGQEAVRYWHPEPHLQNVSPPLPSPFRPESAVSIVRQMLSQSWRLGVLLALATALLIAPQFFLSAIAVAMSLGFGLALSANWAKVLQYSHPIPFHSTDPLFRLDISRYVFALPIGELLEFWLFGLFLYALLAVSLIYLLSGDSISQGSFPGFSQEQQRHLHGLGGLVMLGVALSYWLRRYELLYSPRGVTYGASYTDVTVQLPAYTGLSLLAVGLGGWLLWRTIFWTPTQCRLPNPEEGRKRKGSQRNRAGAVIGDCPYPPQLIYGLTGYVAIAAVAGGVLPFAVQRLGVQPNELARERPYIERTIAFTKEAFDLHNIEERTFEPEGSLTLADLRQNSQTIRNIRLWDARPLLETNRQLQQIRLYYKFPNADIDRYTLKKEQRNPSLPSRLPDKGKGGSAVPGRISPNPPAAEKQQVILAARELDYSAVPQEAKTWVNEHLVYTHGYGFTMSPVNTVGPGGLPDYFVKDIGVGEERLRTSSERIRASIPIGHPRIYYGEITGTYVMAPTKVKELDYPSGEENVYNTYDGTGGVPVGTGWRRWLFAKYLNDWQMVFTGNFTPETKLLFRRNINERVRAIAPFLRYDSDPYLVVARAKISKAAPAQGEENYLYWIADAYTTSDRYPYSDPGKEGFNYIRNSVKAVIDAYSGDVAFYVADPSDPIIASWNAIFPHLFRPLRDMPVTLRTHIRYPLDLFGIQSERLLTYHMTDPQVFYNRDDQWQVPTEIYGSEPRPVEPYYLIMKLPTASSEEFILLHPFTPTKRNNLIAWLAGRSDGENYGKLLLYQFPKQRLVYGPEQIEARINQDPIISQQISLWNRQGSSAIQGNLLVIPIEQSLLYVEPLYLEATQNSLPTLVRVIVAYENRIAMAETLEQALEAIFQPGKMKVPVIVTPIEGGEVPAVPPQR